MALTSALLIRTQCIKSVKLNFMIRILLNLNFMLCYIYSIILIMGKFWKNNNLSGRYILLDPKSDTILPFLYSIGYLSLGTVPHLPCGLLPTGLAFLSYAFIYAYVTETLWVLCTRSQSSHKHVVLDKWARKWAISPWTTSDWLALEFWTWKDSY